ncbi:MAG: Peptidase sortase-like protein [Parcubacteria group bacterium]|nr:Peptidase sortase-like protein [Parcubacteria group bacterium]
MEITTTTINRDPSRRAAVNALAIVGFIALLIIGIGLAIYSARFVPSIASRFGGAAVSLSSIFKKNEDPALQVVTATTTLPFETIVATTTATTTVTAATTTTPVHTSTGTGTGTGQTSTVVTTVTTPVAPHGLSDLAVIITAVGYLNSPGNTSTFVPSNNVPNGKSGAVQFTVTNAGTNYTGSWNFNVNVPTVPAQNYNSANQPSLAPGDSIDYVLGFDRGNSGVSRTITVALDSNNQVVESNEGNNFASRSIDINN